MLARIVEEIKESGKVEQEPNLREETVHDLVPVLVQNHSSRSG